MKKILREDFVFIDSDVKTIEELFKTYSNIAKENKIVDDDKALVKAFFDREEVSSTAFEDGFAIPHARSNVVKEPAIFFVRNKTKLEWESMDGKPIEVAIMLMVPETNGDYLEILSSIASKLMDKEFRKSLKKEKDKQKIIDILLKKEEAKESVVSNSDNALKVVGISACATGVAHTYMARDSILDAAKKMNWTVSIETQGQKGPEYVLTDEEIKNADAVILAIDIAVDLDRFEGKKIYKVGTKTLIHDPETHLRYAVSKGKVLSKEEAESGAGAFDVKNKKAWLQHIMSGVSFMIPFIVFAGIIFAVVTGIGKIIYGTWLDYSGSFDGKEMKYIQNGIMIREGQSLDYLTFDPNTGKFVANISGFGIGLLYYLNSFAGIGFTVMIPIMGAYIANSIAGRSAITPAFVVTFAGVNPSMWLKWGPFADMEAQFPGNGAGIFAALAFGFAVGYLVKWINTKWKINKYIKPIMPIIIIPVFVSLFYGLMVILLLGNSFGYVMGKVNIGLQLMEDNKIGMAGLGLLLGLLAGIDMGGPINKIASFGATALLFTDGGKAMGAAAASFAVAPMGAGIATMIFRKKFKDDKSLGINATILGFMGISEGAIPFAVKYTWAAIIPNIIGSGIAGMCAGLFHVSGWVGAWGGPIIALFGGVTTWDMSYIGILWYLLAIAIGITVHIIIFRILVEVQTKGKLTKEDWKAMFSSKKDPSTKVDKKEKIAKVRK